MRESKMDKYVCLACLIIFLYSFFFIYCTPVYGDTYWFGSVVDVDKVMPQYRRYFMTGLEWSSAVFVAPLAFLMFFFFIVFKKELYPVDRFWVKKKIKEKYRMIIRHIRSNL